MTQPAAPPAPPPVHPDFLGGPLNQQILFRCNIAMAAAIRARAAADDRDVSSLIRALIRAGAPHLEGRPLNLSIGFAEQAANGEEVD